MKKFFVLTLLSLFVFRQSNAQKLPLDPETQKVSYSGVVEIADVKKDQFYTRAQTWFAKTYGSSKAVLEIQDKENGKLFGKGLTDVSFKNPPLGTRNGGLVRYSISLQMKDGKYKYILTDFSHEAGTAENTISCGPIEQEKTPRGKLSSGFPAQFQWNQIKENLNGDMLALVESLKKGMAKADDDF